MVAIVTAQFKHYIINLVIPSGNEWCRKVTVWNGHHILELNYI